ncbi:MAG: DUF2235 domain-containing protein, partial [Alphaproteobacteria bacterium]|nr:DUF2235 domain-containing protein [Alphaproteobacteria bacterium]
MARRIVICFDGTWNTPRDGADLEAIAKGPDGGTFADLGPPQGPETNVCRMFRAVRRVSA